MEAGYYFMRWTGFVFVLTPTGTPALFPTLFRNAGPFALRSNQFSISSPYLPFTVGEPPPSLEVDAIDPADPDGVPNINLVTGFADFDFEDNLGLPQELILIPASLPGASGSVTAVFISSVWTQPLSGVGGRLAFWNVLFDLNQSGAWGDGSPPFPEWVCQDIPVTLTPGMNTPVVSPPFSWPVAGGGPFGRIIFPVWARNMVTAQPVRAIMGARWNGRGPAGGFTSGEIEDYFVEWRRRIGQRLARRRHHASLQEPSAEGRKAQTVTNANQQQQQDTVEIRPDDLIRVQCPNTAKQGSQLRCNLNGLEPGRVGIMIVRNLQTGGGVVGEVNLTATKRTGSMQAEGVNLSATIAQSRLLLDLKQAPDGFTLIIFAEPRDERRLVGNEAVRIIGGALVQVRR